MSTRCVAFPHRHIAGDLRERAFQVSIFLSVLYQTGTFYFMLVVHNMVGSTTVFFGRSSGLLGHASNNENLLKSDHHKFAVAQPSIYPIPVPYKRCFTRAHAANSGLTLLVPAPGSSDVYPRFESNNDPSPLRSLSRRPSVRPLGYHHEVRSLFPPPQFGHCTEREGGCGPSRSPAPSHQA
jgi:hypothetical protein